MVYSVKWYEEVKAIKGLQVFPLADKPNNVHISLTGKLCTEGMSEVQIYIDQLIRKYGPPPPPVKFFILQVNHPWGVNLKAAIEFPKAKESNTIYKYLDKLGKGVKNWDEAALKELKEIGHPFYQDIRILKKLPLNWKIKFAFRKRHRKR